MGEIQLLKQKSKSGLEDCTFAWNYFARKMCFYAYRNLLIWLHTFVIAFYITPTYSSQSMTTFKKKNYSVYFNFEELSDTFPVLFSFKWPNLAIQDQIANRTTKIYRQGGLKKSLCYMNGKLSFHANWTTNIFPIRYASVSCLEAREIVCLLTNR